MLIKEFSRAFKDCCGSFLLMLTFLFYISCGIHKAVKLFVYVQRGFVHKSCFSWVSFWELHEHRVLFIIMKPKQTVLLNLEIQPFAFQTLCFLSWGFNYFLLQVCWVWWKLRKRRKARCELCYANPHYNLFM